MLNQFPVKGEDLTLLIPQKPPFVFISSLEKIEDNKSYTTFLFESNHTLCFDNTMSIAGLLEHLAQSAGCKSGYKTFMAGKQGRIGFIGEIRNFVCYRQPKAGELLQTEIVLEATVFGSVNIISGKTMIGNEEIASCTLKIFFESAE